MGRASIPIMMDVDILPTYVAISSFILAYHASLEVKGKLKDNFLEVMRFAKRIMC